MDLRKYVPTPEQRRFHEKNDAVKAFPGGARIGKTTACMVELIWYATGFCPDWFVPHPSIRLPADIAIISDKENDRKYLNTLLRGLLRDTGTSYNIRQNKYTLDSGSIIRILSADEARGYDKFDIAFLHHSKEHPRAGLMLIESEMF